MTKKQPLFSGPEFLSKMAEVHYLGQLESKSIASAEVWKKKFQDSLKQAGVSGDGIAELDPAERRGLSEIALFRQTAEEIAKQAPDKYRAARNALEVFTEPRIGSILTAKIVAVEEDLSVDDIILAHHFKGGVCQGDETLEEATGTFIHYNPIRLSLILSQPRDKSTPDEHTTITISPFTESVATPLVSLAFASKYE